MKKVILEVYHDGGVYYSGVMPYHKVNVTKLLGGKGNVIRSKFWTYHGGGNWVTEWRIRSLTDATASIIDHGYDYSIVKGDKIICAYKRVN